MEVAERISPVYGFGVAAVSFFGFACLSMFVRLLNASYNISLKDRWKWNNLLVSWIHSVIIGTACIYVLCVYPEILRDIADFHNVLCYTIVAVSAGYFISDSVDIVSCGQTRIMRDVLIHHLSVLSCLAYNIAECRFIGHSLIGLVVELNSVFLHMRKLMQMLDFGFQHPLYQIVCLLNLLSFVVSRFAFSMPLITYGLFAYKHRMSTFYFSMLAPTIAIMWIINVVLFWRLFTNDVLRHRQVQKPVNNDHNLHNSMTANNNRIGLSDNQHKA